MPSCGVDPEDGAEGQAWIAAMRAGDFAGAWAIADRSLARLRRDGASKHDGPRHQQRIWRGEELRRRAVLVRCYHGLGDTIQFIRFARPLRQLARHVIVWCQPELMAIVAGVAGVDLAISLHDGVPDCAFDVDIEIMELPHAIRAGRDQVVMQRPYLECPGRRVPQEMLCPDRFSVGVVWRTSEWDVRRSFPADELRKLDLPDVQLYSLQIGAAARAAAEIGALDISVADLQVLAERLCALDLVICPDSMVAHLAAALGCETWIMLPADCDWRWPERASRTLWYPTVRLFHQNPDRGWSGTFDEVRRALISHRERRRARQSWTGESIGATDTRGDGRGEAATTD